MDFRELDRAKIRVSAICLGTQEFGGRWEWGGSVMPLDECKRIVDFALDAGINFIDTAESYGKSEEILGKVLKGRRDEVVLATKIAGRQWDYDTMRKRLEGSLSRLQTDYVDLYMIHWPKIKGRWGCTSDMEDDDYEDIHTSMERLMGEGLIKVAGVSNFKLYNLEGYRNEAFEVIATDQVPYNILWRSFDEPEIADFCQRTGLRYLTYASLAQGLLTGKYGKDTVLANVQKINVLFNEPVYSRAMTVVDVVREVAGEIGATPAQVALKWVMQKELTVSSLVGIRHVEELQENVEAAGLHLTKEQTDRLEKASLEFWSPMPRHDSVLEMWIPDNTKSNLQTMGIEPHSSY